MIPGTPRTAAESGLMRGSPPPPGRRVTFWNGETPPFNRWSFQHVSACVRTARVWRGERPASRFERMIAKLSTLPRALDREIRADQIAALDAIAAAL